VPKLVVETDVDELETSIGVLADDESLRSDGVCLAAKRDYPKPIPSDQRGGGVFPIVIDILFEADEKHL
jgi:hypothetical protein